MLGVTKKFLFYSLMIISSISFINVAILYWIPIQLPISLFSVTGLMSTAFFAKIYWFIPISLSFCILIFITAFSFSKQQMVLPVILFIYLLFDLLILTYSFFDLWYNDEHFMVVKLIQIVISITIMTFMGIYFYLNWRQKANV